MLAFDHTAMSNETFDFVICGAGSAGCVLADRLSQDGCYSVCVLEAGGMDNWIWFHVPVGYLFAIGNPKSDWLFKTEPEPGLNGRVWIIHAAMLSAVHLPSMRCSISRTSERL